MLQYRQNWIAVGLPELFLLVSSLLSFLLHLPPLPPLLLLPLPLRLAPLRLLLLLVVLRQTDGAASLLSPVGRGPASAPAPPPRWAPGAGPGHSWSVDNSTSFVSTAKDRGFFELRESDPQLRSYVPVFISLGLPAEHHGAPSFHLLPAFNSLPFELPSSVLTLPPGRGRLAV